MITPFTAGEAGTWIEQTTYKSLSTGKWQSQATVVTCLVTKPMFLPTALGQGSVKAVPG